MKFSMKQGAVAVAVIAAFSHAQATVLDSNLPTANVDDQLHTNHSDQCV